MGSLVDMNRMDLLRMLSVLEGKLQASEVAIAALKSERVKRLFYSQISSNERSKLRSNLQKLRTNYATIKLALVSSDDQPEVEAADGSTEITSVEDQSAEVDRTKTTNTTTTSTTEELEEAKRQWQRLSHDPFIAFCRDTLLATDTTIQVQSQTNLYCNQVNALYEMVKAQQKAKQQLRIQLNDLTERFKEVSRELEEERDKTDRYSRDLCVAQIEQLEKDKQKLIDDLSKVKDDFEKEKTREKVMVTSLLAERKELIVRLIEQSDRNDELLKLISSEKGKVAEMVEGLEEESKRSLQMEYDLERLASDHRVELDSMRKRLEEAQSMNRQLTREYEQLKKRLESSSAPSSNPGSAGNSLSGESPLRSDSVRSAVQTLNSQCNQTSNGKTGSPTASTITAPSSGATTTITIVNRNVIKSNQTGSESTESTDPSPKEIITTLNSISQSQPPSSTHSSYATVKPNRMTKSFSVASDTSSTSSSVSGSKTSAYSSAKLSMVNISTSSTSGPSLTTTVSTCPIIQSLNTVKGSSIVSVIQKFQNATPAPAPKAAPPPPLKKPLTTKSLSTVTAPLSVAPPPPIHPPTIITSRPPPPIPPNKPVVTSQLLKERKLIASNSTGSNSSSSSQ